MLLEATTDEPVRCSWRECSEIVLPGRAYQVNGDGYWHPHCFDSPAGPETGVEVSLGYNCDIPDDPAQYFHEKDLEKVKSQPYFNTIKEVSINEDGTLKYIWSDSE